MMSWTIWIRHFVQQLGNEWPCAHGGSKRKLKTTSSMRMKSLDRAVQRVKRHTMQNDILTLHSNNSKEFWKFIRRIDVGSERESCLPWEVCLPDGTVYRDHKMVLNHWQHKHS